MKTLHTLFLVLLCFFLVQCKKDNGSNSPTTPVIPRSGLELLASASSPHFIVAIIAGDTIIMQTGDGTTEGLAATQERMGSHWLVGPKFTLSKTISGRSHIIGLQFYRLDPYNAGSIIPINCSLINDILSQDSLKIGDISKYPYGMEVLYNDGVHNTDSYQWYALHTYYGMMNTIEKTPIATDSSGCTTYRVRGSVNCVVTDPPHTCGIKPVALNYCLDIVL